MQKIAIVTCAGWPNLCGTITNGDDILLESLNKYENVCVASVVWNDPHIDWSEFAMIIIRSTWDYQEQPTKFIAWLEHLRAFKVPVYNPIDAMLWNMDKSYLTEMSEYGIPVPKSIFIGKSQSMNIAQIMEDESLYACIVKPTIGASSGGVYCVKSLEEAKALQNTLTGTRQDLIVQEYLTEIVNGAGEWSLVYFGGNFSHGVVCKPLEGDFLKRGTSDSNTFVPQSEIPVSVRETGNKVMEYFKEKAIDILYCRVDMIERKKTAGVIPEAVLVEVEVIEPSLYLGLASGAPQRFSAEIVKRLIK